MVSRGLRRGYRSLPSGGPVLAIRARHARERRASRTYRRNYAGIASAAARAGRLRTARRMQTRFRTRSRAATRIQSAVRGSRVRRQYSRLRRNLG